MADHQTLNAIATYWTYFVWFVGIAFLTALALLGLSVTAWKLYRHLTGWPVIFKALREYRDRRAPGGE